MNPSMTPRHFLVDTDLSQQEQTEVLELAARCTLVKLSDEDADLLDPGADPDDFARQLLTGERTHIVLLTRGSEGATAYTTAGEASARPRQTDGLSSSP